MEHEQPNRLGEWLRERREAAGLSMGELARATGITHSTITRIESGLIRRPAPNKLGRIAEALGVSLADAYAMANYVVPNDLPSFQPYLRRKYRDMPPEAINDLDAAFAWVARKYGYRPDGPAAGEDEAEIDVSDID